MLKIEYLSMIKKPPQKAFFSRKTPKSGEIVGRGFKPLEVLAPQLSSLETKAGHPFDGYTFASSQLTCG